MILHLVKIELSSTISTTLLLDDGSTGTFITQRVVEELGVTGEPQTCSLGTLTEQPKLMSVSQISLEVSARDGSNRLEIESALVQPAEKFNMPSRPRLEDIRDDDVYTHLDGLEFHAVAAEEVTILIGGDVAEAHIQYDVRRGRKGQPLAM